jgi:DNA-binding XRE family transcriptional regulator
MSELERPPLDRRVFEKIEIMQHVVDQQHWPILAGFQVDAAKKRNPPLPLPKTPMNLLGELQAYASMLFKREADQYGEFRRNPNYAAWLGFVEQRVIARVLRTIAAIEEASRPATLGYHGLTDDEIMEGLGKVLFEVRNSYLWTVPASEPPQVSILTIDATEVGRKPSAGISSPTRETADFARIPTMGEQLKALREEGRLTAEELAEKINVEPRSVYRHLNGSTMPRPRQIAAYEAFFSKRLGRAIRFKTSVERQ